MSFFFIQQLLDTTLFLTFALGAVVYNEWLQIAGRISTWMFAPILSSMLLALLYVIFLLEETVDDSCNPSSTASLSASGAWDNIIKCVDLFCLAPPVCK